MLIKNPIDYEMEYKRRNVWSYHDIQTFLKLLLENPKKFHVIG